MSRLLILGASTLQLPAILKAKEMGHYVAVADYNPQAIGILFADEFFPASTIDIEAICQVAETFHPDGIMTNRYANAIVGGSSRKIWPTRHFCTNSFTLY